MSEGVMCNVVETQIIVVTNEWRCYEQRRWDSGTIWGERGEALCVT